MTGGGGANRNITTQTLSVVVIAALVAVAAAKKKLFVFGDSYVDTGNIRKSSSSPCWMPPYGSTFPRKPSGRFSDGRVLTDFFASYIGVNSPTSYQWRKSVKRSELEDGMSFAYGGTGVFDTMVNQPNMRTQVMFFQQLLHQNVYSKDNLNSSIALVSLAGNDYASYFYKHRNLDLKELQNYTKSVISELVKNVENIHKLGIEKIVVTEIEPMGCLPPLAAFSSYKNCSESWNSASLYHNQLLLQHLEQLNSSHAFFTLNLYEGFMAALETKSSSMEPCCVGIADEYGCGSVDEKGEAKYKVCTKPELSIFWDDIHPSQNGWHAIFSSLTKSSSFPQLL